ncbi:hypothetical protein [Rudaeicoccus suwonensis]|uniref:Uncharacterized protein n=1 Tax=Rudaeicoccus suwonensis TaxID=657409 RepID=A0A561E7Z4_9MICO|nr:hypothetical protein [Rudaeicoccus suwonensis]TWE11727.1 hypothetical protein BKA23_0508 [Rudaeicoccus suwonensis]
MGYDLAFWKGPRTARKPEAIYIDLQNGVAVPDVEALSMADVLSALETAFAGLERLDEHQQAFWDPADQKTVIEFAWSEQHFVATARGAYTNEQLNTIIDVGTSVGARLYDPQVDVRFGGEDT